MHRLLLTGFEPFGSHTYNPSAEVALRLEGSLVEGIEIHSLVLPVVFGEDIRRVASAISRLKPILVLSLGLSSGTSCLDVERFAVNLRYAEHGSGLAPILRDGPAAYMATLPVEKIVDLITQEGIPAHPHCYAGSYLCNHIMYQSLHYLAARELPIPCGFIHLPHASEFVSPDSAASIPSLPLDQIIKGILIGINGIIGEFSG